MSRPKHMNESQLIPFQARSRYRFERPREERNIFQILAPLALGVGSALLGSKASSKANDKAQAELSTMKVKQLRLADSLLKEDKPVRDAKRNAALSVYPMLREEAMRESGTGHLFNRALEQGTNKIFQNLASFGLTDSKVAAQSVGELSSGLLASEIQSIRDLRRGIADNAPNTLGAGIGLLSGAAGTTNNIADLHVNKGNIHSGLFSSLGSGIGGGLGGMIEKLK